MGKWFRLTGLVDIKLGSYNIYLYGQPIALINDNTLYYIYNDQLGRPEVVTNSNANIVWKASNFAFDRTVTKNKIGDLNIGFPGQYWDEEKGSYYNMFRDYDPETGRYLQADPIGLAGGLNTYAYSLNNPITIFDSTGEGPILAAFCGAGIGAIAYGFDWFGVASTVSDVSTSELVEQALGLEEQISDLNDDITDCKDTAKKFSMIQKQAELSKQANTLRRQATSSQVLKSFGGYMGAMGLGAVTGAALCGSLPTI